MVSKEFPKPLTDETGREAYGTLTKGCGDTCLVYPGKRYVPGISGPCRQVDRRGPADHEEIDQLVRALMEQLANRPTQTAPCSIISDG